MDKKYQVFVSSTYRDLIEERQEVMQALLELDCIPVGMELFQAADDDQWTLIKRLIDDCDYYILIVEGRYGSISNSGISYTQMEYEYAVDREIPIISFLHKNPGQISADKTESTPELLANLKQFRQLAERKMCRYWENSSELGSQVSRSLVRLIKDKPRVGWVKADLVPTNSEAKEMLELKNQIEKLTAELEYERNSAPKGAEMLSQGEDTVEIKFGFTGHGNDWNIKSTNYKGSFYPSWNSIFAQISPILLDEATEPQIKSRINKFIADDRRIDVNKQIGKNNQFGKDFLIDDSDFQTIKIQFRALGLIAESNKKRSIHDKDKYWKLTPSGDRVMTQLRAVRKSL
jgi:hypothetical protein